MSAWAYFKPLGLLEFTYPSANTIQMISDDISKLLPWNACLIGLDDDQTHLWTCCLHVSKSKLFIDYLKVEMLKKYISFNKYTRMLMYEIASYTLP